MDRTWCALTLCDWRKGVALQNRFPGPSGDCGWYNVSFMPWFKQHKEEALVLPPRHGPFLAESWGTYWVFSHAIAQSAGRVHENRKALRALAQHLRLDMNDRPTRRVACVQPVVRYSRTRLKVLISPRYLPEARNTMRKTVFLVSSRSDGRSSSSKGGFVNADKTKARFHGGKCR